MGDGEYKSPVPESDTTLSKECREQGPFRWGQRLFLALVAYYV